MHQPKTHMERMGFRDPELTSPEHDWLVLWTQEHAPQWLSEHVAAPPDRWAERNQAMLEHARERIREAKRQAEDIRQRTAEQQARATDSRFFTAAYKQTLLEDYAKDLAKYEKHIRSWGSIEQQRSEATAPAVAPVCSFELEHLIATERGYSLGFIDIVATITYPYYDDELTNRTTFRKAAFEIKVSIPSLGELLRQLRFYQTHFGGYDAEPDPGATVHRLIHWKPILYVVVSPDTRYRPQIVEQGFHFWESPVPPEFLI